MYIFSFKKGSVSRGDAWDSIAEKLNQIDLPQFRIKDKRGVRERWVLLRRKFRSKIREEEAASGVVVEDLTEKEVLIEELIEREDTIKPDVNRLSGQQKNDKDKAEDIRKKAMESMGETKKRKLSRGTTDEDQPTTSGRKRRAQPLVDFLRENANAERELRQQELDIKRKEQEKQQETIQAMMLQQQQMNQAFIAVVKKLRSETNMSLFVVGTKLLLTMTCLQNEITCCKLVNVCQLKHFNPVKVEEI